MENNFFLFLLIGLVIVLSYFYNKKENYDPNDRNFSDININKIGNLKINIESQIQEFLKNFPGVIISYDHRFEPLSKGSIYISGEYTINNPISSISVIPGVRFIGFNKLSKLDTFIIDGSLDELMGPKTIILSKDLSDKIDSFIVTIYDRKLLNDYMKTYGKNYNDMIQSYLRFGRVKRGY
jgi:hypothetical protein